MIFSTHQSTQRFYNKQINTTVLVFVYDVEVLLHVSTLPGYHHAKGRAIAQAVSRWFPTAAARVRARVWQVVIVVDKVALGQVFSEYFGFPCQSSFHQILHHHNHLGQVQIGYSVADVLSGPSSILTIIRQSLHEYVTRYCIVYQYGSRSVIYKLSVRSAL
jgi:hypothetical protein